MKIYVSVLVLMDKSGKIIPKKLIWKDGRSYDIDEVIDVRQSASLKTGGIGVRFRVRIRNEIKDLFLDDYKWFIEI